MCVHTAHHLSITHTPYRRWELDAYSQKPIQPKQLRCCSHRLPGGAAARTGRRKAPTFPLLPRKFRRANFLRYGFKAGRSDGAFVPMTRSSPRAVCSRPSCPSLAYRAPCTEPRDRARLDTSVRAVSRSTPGVLAPVRVIVSRAIVT